MNNQTTNQTMEQRLTDMECRLIAALQLIERRLPAAASKSQDDVTDEEDEDEALAIAMSLAQYGGPAQSLALIAEIYGRSCGKCGKTGHNSRTCGKPKPVKGPRKERKDKGKKRGKNTKISKCHKCGLTGHNTLTCGKPKPVKGPRKMRSDKGKKHICKKCGVPGHYAKKCANLVASV